MNREAFEKGFPVPEGVEWCDTSQHYIGTDNYNPDVWHAAREQDGRLRGWQAAKADSAVQVEALQREIESLKAALAGMASGAAVVTFKEPKP